MRGGGSEAEALGGMSCDAGKGRRHRSGLDLEMRGSWKVVDHLSI